MLMYLIRWLVGTILGLFWDYFGLFWTVLSAILGYLIRTVLRELHAVTFVLSADRNASYQI